MKQIFAGALLAVLMLCGCSQNKPNDFSGKPGFTPEPVETIGSLDAVEDTRPVVKEGQLLALVETQEEAEAIAQQYGIQLVSCDFGVAVFYTEEDPQGVINRGLENGWTQLSLNDELTIG